MNQADEPAVGNQIRALREKKGLSLRALADLSGLSFNAISRIEKGENSPTVSSLHQLAQALEVPIVELFTRDDECSTIFLRPEHRLSTQTKGLVMESLGSGLDGQQLEVFVIRLDPGSGSKDETVSHAGEECVYCLRGSVNYSIDGVEYHLVPGCSLLFDASQPHAFSNPSAEQAEMILIFQSRGDLNAARQRHLEVRGNR